MSTPISRVGGPRKGKCSVKGSKCAAKANGLVRGVRDLKSGNQLNTCDPCLEEKLTKGAWRDQDLINASTSGTNAREGHQRTKNVLEPLVQSYLSVREGPDRELIELAEEELREAMTNAGVRSHATVWKKGPQVIRLTPKLCGLQPGKNDQAKEWLAKNGLPSGIHEAVQEHLDEGGVVPADLFRIRWELNVE